MTGTVSSTCSKKPLDSTSFQSRDLGDIVQTFECQIWKEDRPIILGHAPANIKYARNILPFERKYRYHIQRPVIKAIIVLLTFDLLVCKL